jgi:dihydrolipoamide dehydrogenase
MKHYDVAIIGAGTAGLTARREVAKKTDNYIIIDDGPLGTTCARVGCMPSKVLIQVANDFDRRKKFAEMGISGADELSIDHKQVMQHVRKLRDRFVRGVFSGMDGWEDKLVRKRATFVDANTLDLGDEQVRADKIIVATGSRPILPAQWQPFKEHLIDTNDFFELETLPKKVAVIGLGVIGRIFRFTLMGPIFLA